MPAIPRRVDELCGVLTSINSFDRPMDVLEDVLDDLNVCVHRTRARILLNDHNLWR
jgi:hypothetical protein